MSVVEVEPGRDGACLDPVTARLDSILAELDGLVGDCTPVSEAARIDRIGRLERLRAAVAAVQAGELVRLGQARVAAALAKEGGFREMDPAVADLAPDLADSDLADSDLADSDLADSGLADSGLADSGLADSGLAASALAGPPDDPALNDAGRVGITFDPARIGAGLVDEIGLACRLSPWQAARRLRVARALWFDLPDTFAALSTGGLSEHVADIVVRETRHLDHQQRAEVDRQLADAGITDLGWRAADALAKRFAYQQNRRAYVDRSHLARKDRTVTLRPAPDSMSFLTGLLPLEQGVSCVAALGKAADSAKATGDERSRGQIMADILVERVTGQATDTDLNVEVQIVLPAELLIDPTSTRTAIVQGYGPLPGGVATELIDASRGRKTWRTVWTRSHRQAGGRQDEGGLDGRPRDGRPRDGGRIDGHGLDGHGLDGHGLDGHGLDGHSLDGHGLDGHGLDGQGLDDRAPDRRGLDAETGEGAPHSITGDLDPGVPRTDQDWRPQPGVQSSPSSADAARSWPQPPIVEIDSKRRFTGKLAALILIRDQHCRVPFCGAPIRQLDHIRRHRDGGQTILENGQGLCQRHNQVRETEGWQTNLINTGLNATPHTVDFTTPTGHSYRSQAPDPP